MSDNNNDNNTPDNVVKFGKPEPSTFPKHQPEIQQTDEIEVDPNNRLIVITLQDGEEVEIEGYIGLTGSFLCIGDKEGRIKFAVAQGFWKYCTDITDYVDNEIQEED